MRAVLKILAVLAALMGGTAAWADLGASVSLAPGAPSTIDPGGSTTLRVTLSNSNPAAALTSVSFSNSLPGTPPDGLIIQAPASYSCTDPATGLTSAGAGTLTANPGSQAISLSGGVIPARANNTDGTCIIDIPVTAGTSNGAFATYVYQIASGSVSGNDGAAQTNSGAVSQSVNVNAMARPRITQHFVSNSNTLILGGTAQTLTFRVENPSAVDITNFQFTDSFPLISGNPAFVIASAPNVSASCSSGPAPTVTASAGGALFTVNGTLPAGGFCTWSVDISATTTGGQFSRYVTNLISSTGDWSNDLGIALQSASSRSILLRSPLLVNVNFAHAELANGQSDTMTLTWTNTASQALTVTGFTNDPIDGVGNAAYGLKINGTPSMSCSAGGIPGTLATLAGQTGFQLTSATTIAAGGTCTITLTFTGTVQATGVPITFTNTINAGDLTVGPINGAGVVSQSSSDSILVGDEIRVSISASPSQAAAGQPIRYIMRIENFGGAAVSNLSITDALPAGTSLLTGTIGGIDFTPSLSGDAGCAGLVDNNSLGDTSAIFGLGTLPARLNANQTSSCYITYWVMAPAAGGSVSNNIPAGAITWNGGASSNAVGSNTVTTSGTPALAIVNNFNPSSTFEGNISTLTLTFTNWTAQALANLAFTDNLPSDGVTGGQLTIAPIPNASTNCAGGTISATAGASSFSFSGGSVPARASGGLGTAGSCFVKLDVIGPAGSYGNAITATADAANADGSGTAAVSATSNTATLNYASALSATTFFTPASVAIGGRAVAIIRLANSGSAVLTGVGLTDTLPAGLTVSAATAPYSTCGGAPAITTSGGGSTIAMSGASLPGGATCDLVFEVDAASGGPWTNTIPTGGIFADNGVININPVSATLGLLPGQNLFLAKSTNPSSISFPGQDSVLQIDITNGSSPVTGLSLTDYFTADGTAAGAPNGMVIAGTPQATTTCPGGTVSATPGAASVSLSGASLAANATCQINVKVTSIAVGGITNIIPPAAVVTDQGYSNANQALTSLTTNGALGVVKSFSPTIIQPGQRSRMTITINNPTTTPVAGLTLTDALPAGMSIPPGPNPATTCTGGTIGAPANGPLTLSGGTLGGASGGTAASCTLSVDVTASTPGTLTNTVQAGGVTGTAGGIPVTNPQPASADLTVAPPLEVQIAIQGKTLDSAIQSGAPFTTGAASSTIGASEVLTIRLRNPSAIDLSGVAFTDLLPSGLVLTPTPNGSTTCAGGTVSAPVSGTAIALTGASLPAGAACTVSANVLSNAPGIYTDDIPVGDVTSYEGVSNALATSAQLVILDPPTVGLEFDLPVIQPGGTSTAIISLGNPNGSPLTLTAPLVVSLPVAPGAILVDPVPSIGGSCTGAVTATAGGATITYASGATIPPGGCDIRVNVTGTVPGDYTGVIPSGDLQTTSGPNFAPATAPLSISTQGFISGKVFADNDVSPDGNYAAPDQPIAGVSVELRSGGNCSGALIASQSTDASGNFLFFPLAAGTYSLCEPGQPAGTLNGTTTAGPIQAVNGSTGTPGTPSNPSATSSEITGIVLGANGGDVSGSPNNWFAEVVTSTISGTVFLDHDNDGALNGPDAGIGGETIELVQGGSIVASTTTAADGSYSFSGLAPGTYDIRQPAQPANTTSGKTIPGAVPNGGTAGSASAPTSLPSLITGLVLPPNTTAPGNNFAEIPNSRTISGTVFLDYGDDGTLNGPDYGLPGEQIDLTGTDVNGGSVSASTTTDGSGNFSFAGLPEGTYALSQPNQPPNTTDGKVGAGSTGGTPTAQGTTPSAITGIDLTGANTVSGGNLFAEVPGNAPDVTVSITHSPASFAENNTNGVYVVTGSNVGTVDTSGTVTITTTLPAGITPTGASGTGWSCAIAAQVVSCTSAGVISANGGSAPPITITTAVGSGLAGNVLTANAAISGGGEPALFNANNTDSDPVAVNNFATVSGHIWRDLDHDRVFDPGEPPVAGWKVELVNGGTVFATATTDANGFYQMTNLQPGAGYEIRFREPLHGAIFGAAVPNETGAGYTNGVVDPAANPAGADTSSGILKGLTLSPGQNVPQQSLPLDPAGVVYDSLTRLPVSGATVTISGPPGFTAADVVGGSLSTITGADGLYQFLLLPGAPNGTYTLSITTYPGAYVPMPSAVIPACTATLNVGAAPNPALVQNQASPPPVAATIHDPAACPTTSAGLAGGFGSTQYFMSFALTGASANVLNNHIPLDPVLGDAFTLTKTTPRSDVRRGELVPYTITATNTQTFALSNIAIVDTMPVGFTYVPGSATIDGVPVEPAVSGSSLSWSGLGFGAGASKTLELVLRVGAGVGDGVHVNRAQAMNTLANAAVSNEATAAVRIAPDPVFDCADVIGKVFDDANGNGIQDEGEAGIPGATVSTVNGVLITTDENGRYHVPCAAVPDSFYGSNFIMKLDESTLPFGYLPTTENPEVERLTRGRMARINFGAARFRVAQVDLFEDAFREAAPIGPLRNAMALLPRQLCAAPTIVRLVHMGRSPLAERRLDALERDLRRAWARDGCSYALHVERVIRDAPISAKDGK